MGTKEMLAVDGSSEVEAALWRLEDARTRTLRVLEDVPGEFLDQETQGNTIGTILYHVALIETDWLFVEVLGEPVPPELKRLLPVEDRDEEGVLVAVRGESLEQHLARLREVRETLLSRLRTMTPEDFDRTREFPNYHVSPAWVLHHLAQHEAEHRGELGWVINMLRAAG